MQAIVCEKYGPPEALQLRGLEKPIPKEGEVLLRVHAASVNPADWHLIRGAPFLARMSAGLLKPKDKRVGSDLAGRVEAVGGNITQLQAGAEVFGLADGSFAEYAIAREDRLVPRPVNVSSEAAAAVPLAALTALQGLRDKGQIGPGKKVLINGASGGVGGFAVQIAKSFGTEVTGVCSTQNVDLVRSMGADHVIDYTKEDFTRNGQRYDLIFDAVGNHSVSDRMRALTPQGICVVAGFGGMSRLIGVALLGRLTSRKGGRRISLMLMKPNHEDLIFLKGLLEAGKLVPVIDRRYTLNEVPQAIRYLEGGHARGKVIISVENPS